MPDAVGRFRGADARARFMRAFDRAMETWPARVDHQVETSYGATVVSASRTRRSTIPALLLPGGGSTIASWGPFVSAWESERQIFAVDTIWDAGRSVQTKPLPTGAEVASWLEQTLDGLGIEKVHLVGFSYGGWAALNQLVRFPSRLQSVTALDPPGSLAPIPLGTWARMLAMLLGDEERYRSYLAWVRGGKLPESTTLDLLIASRREFVQAGTPRPQRIAPSEWAALDSRVAVLLGGKSRFVPRRAEATLRRRAPESEVKRFPNASHALLVDEAEAITQYVNTFMRDRDAL